MGSQIRSIVIGTAGHIDHGKTTLVKALTGIDADRLPEEKRRGITVDLGFASLETKDLAGRPLRFSFVDVPGHHLFIHNMLAGAAGIDCALLVISAEEGIKPQTVEHLHILDLLGIRAGLTALTKCDAVSATRLQEVSAAVSKFLGDRFHPVVPVSANTGAGTNELVFALKKLAEKLSARDAGSLLHLPIDRSFVMKGFGTVVTGTLQSGTIARGQSVLIEPGGRKVRVRGLQIHGGDTETATAGSRVAVNLANVEVADVKRGLALVQPETFAPVETIDVELRVLPDAVTVQHRLPVHVHAFTSAVDATVLLYNGTSIEPGQCGLARLKLKEPIMLSNGHRFVLRQWSPLTTIAGGIVLDAYPVAKQPKARRREWLDKLSGATPEDAFFLRVKRRAGVSTPVQKLMVETGQSEAAIVLALNKLKSPVPGFAPRTLPTLDPVAQKRVESILAVYAAAGLDSPSPEEVGASLKISSADMRKLMTLLLRDKSIVKIGLEELYIHKDAVGKLQTQLQQLKGRWIDVGTFKEMSGLTRKRAIPLLEYFDRNRVTRREGDKRLVL